MDNQMPVLLVDDEEHALKATQLALKLNGIKEIVTLNDSRHVLPLLESSPPGVIVLDLFMPHISGIELLPMIKEKYPSIPVIVITAVNEVERAVESMKAGAFDYLLKPVETERLLASVRKAFELQTMQQEMELLRECLLSEDLKNPEAFEDIVTRNSRMQAVFRYAEMVAASVYPILITGESGVGKELMAAAIHRLSNCKGELVAINLAGLDDAMFSDTLFGHRKGAFTGADQERKGLVSLADKGTLFLDEIGDLGSASQLKLLRLLQEREYYQVGSDQLKKCSARIVCASNRNLKKLVLEGTFRSDLFYRLNAHHLRMLPLKERLDDIPALLEHFLTKAAQSFARKKPAYPRELLSLLSTYHFPGNVRELQSMVYDAMARHETGILSMQAFRDVIDEERTEVETKGLVSPTNGKCSYCVWNRFPKLREVESFYLDEALALAGGNQGIAAAMLGLTRQTLNARLMVRKKRPENE